MAETYVKFDEFVLQLGRGEHLLHTGQHTVQAFLTNTTPLAGTHVVYADVTPVTEENGYTEWDVGNDYTETGGIATLSATTSKTWTATGAVETFQHAILYNVTQTTPLKPLIGYWTRAAGSVTLANGETFKLDFAGTTIFTFQ